MFWLCLETIFVGETEKKNINININLFVEHCDYASHIRENDNCASLLGKETTRYIQYLLILKNNNPYRDIFASIT